MLGDFFFDGFGGDVVAGVENDEVLDAAADAPVAAAVHFALIAGVEPAVFEDAGGFLGTIPVARKNIGAGDKDFFILAGFHFDARNGLADAARFGGDARVVHGADSAGFRQAIDLPDGDTEHREEILCFGSERRGAADQAAQIGTEAFTDFAEDEFLRRKEPKAAAGLAFVLLSPRGAAFFVNGLDERAAFRESFFDAALYALQQRGHVEKIVGSREADLVGKLVQV